MVGVDAGLAADRVSFFSQLNIAAGLIKDSKENLLEMLLLLVSIFVRVSILSIHNVYIKNSIIIF